MATKKKFERTNGAYSVEAFDAIQELSHVPAGIRGLAAIVGSTDAVDTLVFARQLETISNTLYKKDYVELKGTSFVHVSNEIGEYQDYFTWRVWDGVTLAVLFVPGMTNIPMVDSYAYEQTIKFHRFVNGYGFNVFDLQKAAALGIPLETQDADLARDGHAILLDDAIAQGIRSIGSFGLINQPNVTLRSVPTGTWSTATGEQMLADMNYLVAQQTIDTGELMAPDTFLMSVGAYQIVSKKLLNSAGGTQSVLSVFKEQNPDIRVASWSRLNTANAAGNNGRMVVYKNDKRVVEFMNGKSFSIGPAVLVDGLYVRHVCDSRLAGCVIRHPKGICYADNQLA